MKRAATLIATALSLALATGALVGCGGQQSSMPAEPEASAEATEQSQEELLTEFQEMMTRVPVCKSVTVTAEESSVFKKDNNDTVSAKTVYKFDESGVRIRTSSETEIEGIKMAYYTDGDDAVFVTDGPIYSGTTEQFGLNYTDGVHTYLKDIIGEPGVLADCATKVEKLESEGLTFYTLTLDIDKYTATDEALKALADSGMPLTEAVISVGFNDDGSICSLDKKLEYEDIIALWNLGLSDHDNTVVDPMPEATKTYEEMEADMAEKFEEAFEDEEPATDAESN